MLAGKSVLITGGTGTFGNAFARKALADGAARVVVFSRSESKQAQMAAELNDPRMRYFIGDVRDGRRVSEAVRGCDYVVHAAALKRVEVCENEPREAIATNVVGTDNVARACVERGVARCVFLSTDKAAAPETVYGHTKAVAERLWIRSNVYAAGTGTRFSATRYGNVLGSTGSVLTTWRAQYAANRPLTLTDERCTRFWMTLEQAVDLVCLALREMRGGEVFVPVIGGAPILDLARAVVETNGTYGPGHVCMGLRESEKLHETLVSDEEARHTYSHGSHLIIEPTTRTWGEQGTPNGEPLAAGYHSHTGPRLTVQQLRGMIG